VYERLHRIGQKLKEEEQTWQILFYLGVDAPNSGPTNLFNLTPYCQTHYPDSGPTNLFNLTPYCQTHYPDSGPTNLFNLTPYCQTHYPDSDNKIGPVWQ
jgi:ligand-binding sensor protein